MVRRHSGSQHVGRVARTFTRCHKWSSTETRFALAERKGDRRQALLNDKSVSEPNPTSPAPPPYQRIYFGKKLNTSPIVI